MTTKNIIEGLTILEKYRSKPDGYNCGAEHDEIFGFATDLPLSEEDLARMLELGWSQVEFRGDDDMKPTDYDPEDGWSAYV